MVQRRLSKRQMAQKSRDGPLDLIIPSPENLVAADVAISVLAVVAADVAIPVLVIVVVVEEEAGEGTAADAVGAANAVDVVDVAVEVASVVEGLPPSRAGKLLSNDILQKM